MQQENFFSFPTSKVFKNKDYLDVRSIPKISQILHRDSQIKEISKEMAKLLQGQQSFMFVYGSSGTGKTSTVVSLSDELLKQYAKKINVFYVNCYNRNREFKILDKMFEALHLKTPLGLSNTKIYEILEQKITENNRSVLLILDEADKIDQRDINDVIYRFYEMSENIYRSKKLSISMIFISNVLNILDKVDIRIKSRLNDKVILFPGYTAPELIDIATERTKNAVNAEFMSPSFIARCSAMAAQESGDARTCISLLNTTYELLEDDPNANLNNDGIIEDAENKLQFNDHRKIIISLPQQIKVAFLSILDCSKNSKSSYVSNAYENYVKLCKTNNLRKVTFRQFHRFADHLEKASLIRLGVISNGRYGRKTSIEVLVNDLTISMLRQELENAI